MAIHAPAGELLGPMSLRRLEVSSLLRCKSSSTPRLGANKATAAGPCPCARQFRACCGVKPSLHHSVSRAEAPFFWTSARWE